MARTRRVGHDRATRAGRPGLRRPSGGRFPGDPDDGGPGRRGGGSKGRATVAEPSPDVVDTTEPS
ncbi:hypothetical protein, partial [Streptomyces sp. NPDC000851]